MLAMLPLMRVLEQGGKFVQCVKHGLTLRGIDCGPPRRPLQPLKKDEKRELAEVIRTLDTAIAAIVAEGTAPDIARVGAVVGMPRKGAAR